MSKKEKKIIIVLVIALVAIDQILKIFFLLSNWKIGNKEGLSFGILEIESIKNENNITYLLFGIIALMAIIRYINNKNSYIKIDSRIMLSFAIAGIVSNLFDRIWNKSIINYINIPKFTSINLGYVYFIITWIGMAVILTKYTRERIKEKNR